MKLKTIALSMSLSMLQVSACHALIKSVDVAVKCDNQQLQLRFSRSISVKQIEIISNDKKVVFLNAWVLKPKSNNILYLHVHDIKYQVDTNLPLQVNADYVVSVRASGYMGFAAFRAVKECALTYD